MKTTKLLTIILFGLMLFSFSAISAQEKAEAKVELKNQTTCPVMGGKIDSTVFTDIQGQRVYHCCPMCSKKLKDDPDKFFKKAAEEGILFENVQTTCPVSGEALADKSVYSDFEGRRVYFCCKKCRGTFADNPQKVIDNMGGMKEKVEVKKVSGHDHSGHNH